MKIKYDKYTIKSDTGGGFSISESIKGKSKDGSELMCDGKLTFHGTVDLCINEIFNRKIHRSKRRELRLLAKDIILMRKEIKEFFSL